MPTGETPAGAAAASPPLTQTGKQTAKTLFATPLPQSPRSEILEWRFPRPHSQYVLTGRSRAAWHTSFVIPQLNLLLDAGLCVNKVRPKHVFLTHGHSDHTLLLPAFVDRDDRPDVYCPAEIAAAVDAFVDAKTVLTAGGVEGDAAEGEETADEDNESNSRHGSEVEGPENDWNGKGKRPRGPTALDTHLTHGLRPGDTVALVRARAVTATAFACDHTVPCLGYVFSQTSRRLRPEYRELDPAEIKKLRQSGVEITTPHSSPIFAFLGDTTAATLSAEEPWGRWLRQGIPVVITECSFLREEHRRQAEKTKHTIWADLEPVVRRWPATTFVLVHFSLRYDDDDIRRFFADMADPPPNIVVWADGGEG